MARRTFRFVDGKVTEVTRGGPDSAATRQVQTQRDFVPFVSEQVSPTDPAIDEVGLKRSRLGQPIFETRRQAEEFSRASQGREDSQHWQHDGLDSKPRVPKWQRSRQISTRKGGSILR